MNTRTGAKPLSFGQLNSGTNGSCSWFPFCRNKESKSSINYHPPLSTSKTHIFFLSSAMKIPTLSLSLLFCVIVILTLSSYTKAEVITLTPETFSDKVKEKDTVWFVKFCVPWCKHCKNLGSLWDDLGKAMEGEDEIEVGEVDCGVSKPVCAKVDIHSYPTFKVFYDGEEVAKYQGPRDVESLKEFVVEEGEKAAAKAQIDDDKEL